jgi:hypothetical protein
MNSVHVVMRASARLSVPLVLAALCGCGSTLGATDRVAVARSVRDAASVHVAAIAVAPWSHYEQALLPEYQLTAEQARELVVRSALTEAESTSNRIGLGLAAEQDATRAPSALPSDRSGASLHGVSAPKDRPDAMLEYWNATALFQEVQLLNRTLLDAAVPSGHRAYLVRLQIGLMPRRRHQPYDAYTTLSFFSGSSVLAPQGAGGAAPATALRDLPAGTAGPRVLPLLVSDNLEASDVSRAQEEIRRLALTLSAFPGDFAASAAADLLSKSFSAEVAGRDLNSLLTVARVSENTLRVRIGAMREPSAGHALVPRNHYVTVILTVPEDAPADVQVVARTELVDTRTGAELPGTSEAELDAAVATLAREYGLPALDRAVFDELLAAAQRNDARGFELLVAARLAAPGADLGFARSLWLDTVALMAGSRWGGTWLELPGHGRWELLGSSFFGQTPLALDDGATTRVELAGASFADGVALAGNLFLAVDDREVVLPAQRIERDSAARRVVLVFPSLASIGLADEARALLGVGLSWADESQEFDALYVDTHVPADEPERVRGDTADAPSEAPAAEAGVPSDT